MLPANTLTAARTLILTPGANGLAYICEIGTQAFNYTINQNGAAGGTLYTVLAGTRFAMWVGSDGTDLVFPREAPLGAEPLL
ncbi:MAG TPA: hypothetical protein VNG33_23555 [Polyangiaceae bacterium]|nr:hypothetical protein [Polyangiaceae bacterium]